MLDTLKPSQITIDHRIVFMFSGQGSHYRGMGKNLYNNCPNFSQALNRSDLLLQERLGVSLVKELYSEGNSSFDNLQITHPAIVSVELALWSVLLAAGVRADYAVGSSLGEFAAAAVCGCWSPESAVEAAMVQASSIVENNEKGGMLVIPNIRTDELFRLLAEYNLHIASNNFPGHYTLSGTVADLDALEVTLKTKEKLYMRLPVTYPFHSPLLTAGKAIFLHNRRSMPSLNPPGVKFVSGLYAGELTCLPEDYFWEVVSRPADFMDSVSALEKKGPCLYVDMGPSGTSATFVKYNLPADSLSIVHPIMTPFNKEDRQLKELFRLLKTVGVGIESAWI